jgi:CorA-like Mg2+ transporter protein
VLSCREGVQKLEQQVIAGRLGNAEEFLVQMFRARHGLLAVRNMATLSREIYGRMATLEISGTGRGQTQLTDIVDQFQCIATIADGQKDYLQGVIEYYQTRTNTRMTVAAERLAVIAAVTLPITALSSVPRMNIIVNTSTHWLALTVLLVVLPGCGVEPGHQLSDDPRAVLTSLPCALPARGPRWCPARPPMPWVRPGPGRRSPPGPDKLRLWMDADVSGAVAGHSVFI